MTSAWYMIFRSLLPLLVSTFSFFKGFVVGRNALNKSGYNYNLTYRKPSPDTKHRKNRPRNIIWFNPPYSQNVKTKVGKCFLTLIDKHFPKSNPLHKILNRNTLKLSYSCMNNVKAIISNHNKAVISRSSNLITSSNYQHLQLLRQKVLPYGRKLQRAEYHSISK